MASSPDIVTTVNPHHESSPHYKEGDTVIYHPWKSRRNLLTTTGTVRHVQTHPHSGINASPSNPHYHITNNTTGRPHQMQAKEGKIIARVDIGSAEEGKKRVEEQTKCLKAVKKKADWEENRRNKQKNTKEGKMGRGCKEEGGRGFAERQVGG
ncbi:hypothetical protein BJ508DRAFT_322389 [Ascobolus immersus RN42]|uniref:Uncharacterized protein n=1 Tax=Ascobolus immersus RN42 TaxID=1160509 RepID=A0A3N4INL0_ASCIM|nr:hypothetical protein BJ508DRAFT_322389 [Ascobolus immersus RN42]